MILDFVFWLLAAAIAVPTATLALQVLAGTAGKAPRADSEVVEEIRSRPTVAVLVPAHDEESGVAKTLATVFGQLRNGDRLVVVADNCADATAEIARSEGAEVIERVDETKRGKGYALDAGIRYLQAVPPDIVVVVDADCTLHAQALERLVTQCVREQRPAQALYLMHAHKGAALGARMAELAWLVKNRARPLGAQRLGMPCSLMGTGMAFPWASISTVNLASGHIVEDMRLGLDLAAMNHAPRFCPEAVVSSSFPVNVDGASRQRTRWEHGHLALILWELPRFAGAAILKGNKALAAMVLDLCVPPLTVLALLLAIQLLMSTVAHFAFSASLGPLIVSGASAFAFAAAVFLVWFRFGRTLVSLRELLTTPMYILAKLPMYARFFRQREVRWVRARRDSDDDA